MTTDTIVRFIDNNQVLVIWGLCIAVALAGCCALELVAWLLRRIAELIRWLDREPRDILVLDRLRAGSTAAPDRHPPHRFTGDPMTQQVDLTEEQLGKARHAAAVQNVIEAVERASEQVLADSNFEFHRYLYTHDIAYVPTRVNMMSPLIARTSVVHCVKDYFREISKPVIDTMFIATDQRSRTHGSKGPRH